MHVDLKLDRNALVVQESTHLSITLSNDSPTETTIFDPTMSGVSPVLRVTDERGHARDFTVITRASALDPEFMVWETAPPVRHFRPGEQASVEGDLLSWVGTLQPGRYSVQAIVEYESVRAASAPIALTVGPLSLDTVNLEGSSTSSVPFWDLVFTHKISASQSIVVMRTFELQHYQRLIAGVRVGVGTAGSRPVASIARPGVAPHGNFVAWLDGDVLGYAFAREGRVTRASERFPLERPRAIIGPALHAMDTTTALTDGTVFILQRGAARDAWQVAAVHLRPSGGAELRGVAPLATGPEPRWTRAAQFYHRSQHVLALVEAHGQLQLEHVHWPRSGAPSHNTLATWTGSFVASAATSLDTDLLAGATLVRAPEPQDKRLRLIAWKLDPSGHLTASPPQVVHWPEARGWKRVVLRIDPHGRACGILQGAKGEWFVFDHAGATAPVAALPADLEHLDLVFGRGGTPVLQLATRSGGFSYRQLDGTAVPGW